MFFRWILFACFFATCLTLNISGLCERINLCRVGIHSLNWSIGRHSLTRKPINPAIPLSLVVKMAVAITVVFTRVLSKRIPFSLDCAFLFCSDQSRRLNVSNWFYDSNQRHCHRYENQTNDFVYFRFLEDCTRLCLTDGRNITDQKRNPSLRWEAASHVWSF